MAKIMILEDHFPYVNAMEYGLGTAGHEVSSIKDFFALSIEDVRKQVEEFDPDVLLLDHLLFEGEVPYCGLDITRLLPSKLPIVGISSSRQKYLKHSFTGKGMLRSRGEQGSCLMELLEVINKALMV